ncbi:NUDIX domain-containing protein [Fictibacillus sp. KU28468]|uniref:NUDIX domain-containing protein n=1 Tax=Fictibacillus sp. KU28468 TaxID=2991053 RepID=UPI00223D3F65|nr:NUDIX hydrolase [Fictibacillus sp. KU28468]UZJ78802.1 NUDIX hydrolase [Fictibacillus sp. KU28468]
MDAVWYGAAGICRNEENKIVMVLQRSDWGRKGMERSIGQVEPGETFQECCAREFWEETGYRVKVGSRLFIKKCITYGIEVEVHYFEATILSGVPAIQDPDQLIHEISWKTAEEIGRLILSFPEDRPVLIEMAEPVSF